MKVLFIHQNMPGQYVHAARYLAQAGHEVTFITQPRSTCIAGVRKLEYRPDPAPANGHPYGHELDSGVANGLAVARLCQWLARDGVVPDIVIGHNGWGEILFVKDIWPHVPLLGYFEFFYRPSGSDFDFDREFPLESDAAMRLRTRNALNLLGLETADWGQCPTEWQRSQYPKRYRDCITVVHEGVDTALVKPDRSARLWLSGGRCLSPADEIVTFSARDLEPYRGFHVFMRALPRLLAMRPEVQVLILGGDGVSYGRKPDRASCWRAQMLNELEGKLDLRRVHFLGHLPYQQYLTVLQISMVHVYLTYPFVLSWSLLEAMAAGCLIVSSRTPPVEEVIREGESGYLVDFFDVDGLADRIASELGREDRAAQDGIRAAAREKAVRCYDVHAVCLPSYLDLFRSLLGSCSAA